LNAPLRRRYGTSVCLLCLAVALAHVEAQDVALTTSPDGLHVRAPGFHFLEGQVLKRLRDGQSVAIELALEVLAAPAGRVLARADQRVNVSFDLWEQRFAVTRAGSPPRSVSQLTAAAAETWCLDNLTIPRAELDRLGRDEQVWIRLIHRVREAARPDADDGDWSLATLIDALSRRQTRSIPGRPLEAGPFRLP
jgi:hypothetical protein